MSSQVEAEVKTASGLSVHLKGDVADVRRIITFIQFREDAKARHGEARVIHMNSMIRGASISGQLMQIKEAGFFDTPRSLADIKNGLAEKGYNYPSPLLAAILLRNVRRGLLEREQTPDGFRYKVPRKKKHEVQ